MGSKIEQAQKYAKSTGLVPGQVLVPPGPNEKTRIVYSPASPYIIRHGDGLVPAKFETVENK
jgi:hypothetical protein